MVSPVSNLPDPSHDDEHAAELWRQRIAPQYSAEDNARIAAACDLMIGCRASRRLDTGETEARHRLATADVLYGVRMDAETLCAALLHGCLGRAGLTEEALAARFGAGLARMVADLGRIGQLANVERVVPEKDQARHEENLRRLLLGIAEDVRVVLVVLAERVHLMRAAKHLDPARQRELAEDTRRIYAPLANRLGIWQFKWELEDLALRYLEPAEYKRIAHLLRERREERQAYIRNVIAMLTEEFDSIGMRVSITGRPKHIYSIWRKMKRKGVDIAGIFDLRAVRILVETVRDCYTALGIVHGLWRHIPKEFDDYIATPKGNMYQSLHTAVIGPDDQPLEVQIRTFDMHKHAEFGVAAHWAYKEATGHDAEFQRRITWMRNWLEQMAEGDQNEDLLERFKAEFQPVHVYVLTPKAKVIELPRGATPLDFAYAIHSEIGNHCRGARVDGRIVPLTYRLNSGETVEIITQANATPSRDWLSPHQGYLVTARARNRIRQWFKQQDFDRYLNEGRAALERELARLGHDGKPQHLDRLAPRFNLNRGDDLLAAIGRGDLAVGVVARQLLEARQPRPGETGAEPGTARTDGVPRRAARSGRAEVIVNGVTDLLTRMATCCRPVPYDKIVGYVTRGRGVIVHRRNCPNILSLSVEERERLIPVSWAEQPVDAAYPVDLVILASDRKGLLRDVSSVMADEDANVLSTESRSDPRNDLATMHFIVEVSDNDQLDSLVAKLKQLPDVLDVRRGG